MADEQSNTIYLAALAGLLHDIGNFARRAAVGKRELTDQQALAEVCCEHALYSDSFVQEYVPASIRAGLSAPRRHHRPQSDQDYQVQLADWLSSGEREEDEGSRFPVPYLLSIFARLKGHQAEAYLPLARLDPTAASIFPTAGKPAEWRETYRQAYEALWGQFTEACERLRGESRAAIYLESLYGLLQEFTWCVPSAWYHAVPDVSLYDHARTTAALAACLAADGRDRAWCQEALQALENGPADGDMGPAVCLSVGGDINGVQSFIYTLASAGAAKSLRARSFYLQMLTEVVTRYLLDQVGLPTVNLLYAGGGIFQALVPLGAEADLERIRADIATRLLHIHDGALGLVLEWTPLRAGEFRNLRKARRRLGACLNAAKRRPFATVEASTLSGYVGTALPFDTGGDLASSCDLCGAPGPDPDGKCSFCRSLEQLGAFLPHATHIVAYAVPAEEPRRVRHWQEGLRTFGFDLRLAEAGGDLEYVTPPPAASRAYIWRGQPHPPAGEAQLLARLGALPAVQAYRPLAQLVPQCWNEKERTAETATFNDLAEKSARGIHRWGVLRMDVDDLGELFRNGFARPTLSHTAALSRALQVFFEGYVPRLGAEWNRYSRACAEKRASQADEYDRLYLQYAGGDDLFMVGAWDALPEFAARLRLELSRYACDNPAVTISGGISLADSKYPLHQAAGEAGEAQETAKRYCRTDGRRKDALAFLSQAIGWEQYAEVQEQAYRLAEWCGSGLAPRALLQLLQAIDVEWRQGLKQVDPRGQHRQGKPRLYYGRWMWQLVYSLTRAAQRSKHREVIDGIAQIERDLLGKESSLVTLGLVARWAEFLIRK